MLLHSSTIYYSNEVFSDNIQLDSTSNNLRGIATDAFIYTNPNLDLAKGWFVANYRYTCGAGDSSLTMINGIALNQCLQTSSQDRTFVNITCDLDQRKVYISRYSDEGCISSISTNVYPMGTCLKVQGTENYDQSNIVLDCTNSKAALGLPSSISWIKQSYYGGSVCEDSSLYHYISYINGRCYEYKTPQLSMKYTYPNQAVYSQPYCTGKVDSTVPITGDCVNWKALGYSSYYLTAIDPVADHMITSFIPGQKPPTAQPVYSPTQGPQLSAKPTLYYTKAPKPTYKPTDFKQDYSLSYHTLQKVRFVSCSTLSSSPILVDIIRTALTLTIFGKQKLDVLLVEDLDLLPPSSPSSQDPASCTLSYVVYHPSMLAMGFNSKAESYNITTYRLSYAVESGFFDATWRETALELSGVITQSVGVGTEEGEIEDASTYGISFSDFQEGLLDKDSLLAPIIKKDGIGKLSTTYFIIICLSLALFFPASVFILCCIYIRLHARLKKAGCTCSCFSYGCKVRPTTVGMELAQARYLSVNESELADVQVVTVGGEANNATDSASPRQQAETLPPQPLTSELVAEPVAVPASLPVSGVPVTVAYPSPTR